MQVTILQAKICPIFSFPSWLVHPFHPCFFSLPARCVQPAHQGVKDSKSCVLQFSLVVCIALFHNCYTKQCLMGKFLQSCADPSGWSPYRVHLRFHSVQFSSILWSESDWESCLGVKIAYVNYLCSFALGQSWIYCMVLREYLNIEIIWESCFTWCRPLWLFVSERVDPDSQMGVQAHG